jgi:hypothetical protein
MHAEHPALQFTLFGQAKQVFALTSANSSVTSGNLFGDIKMFFAQT